jgi:hypothetical protein
MPGRSVMCQRDWAPKTGERYMPREILTPRGWVSLLYSCPQAPEFSAAGPSSLLPSNMMFRPLLLVFAFLLGVMSHAFPEDGPDLGEWSPREPHRLIQRDEYADATERSSRLQLDNSTLVRKAVCGDYCSLNQCCSIGYKCCSESTLPHMARLAVVAKLTHLSRIAADLLGDCCPTGCVSCPLGD